MIRASRSNKDLRNSCLYHAKPPLEHFYQDTGLSRLTPKHQPQPNRDESHGKYNQSFHKKLTKTHNSHHHQTFKPTFSFNPQQALIETVKQLELKLFNSQAQAKHYKQEMANISEMLGSYFESNHILAQQYKQQISAFQVCLLNLSKDSEYRTETRQNQLQNTHCTIQVKNSKINGLEKDVRGRQNELLKLQNQRRRSPSFLKVAAKDKQSLLGSRLKQLTQQNKELKEKIVNMGEDHKIAVKEYSDIILQKGQIIRKMSQFNSQMCLNLLKQRQNFNRVSRINSPKEDILKEQQRLANTEKQLQLSRVKSAEEFKHFKQQMNEQKSTLDQQNLQILRLLHQTQRENSSLRTSVKDCNQKIQSLQLQNKKQNIKIDELINYIEERFSTSPVNRSPIGCCADKPSNFNGQKLENIWDRQFSSGIYILDPEKSTQATYKDKRPFFKTETTPVKMLESAVKHPLRFSMVQPSQMSSPKKSSKKIKLQQSRIITLRQSLKNQSLIGDLLKDRLKLLQQMKSQEVPHDKRSCFHQRKRSKCSIAQDAREPLNNSRVIIYYDAKDSDFDQFLANPRFSTAVLDESNC